MRLYDGPAWDAGLNAGIGNEGLEPRPHPAGTRDDDLRTSGYRRDRRDEGEAAAGDPRYRGNHPPERIALVGDLHGNLVAARRVVEKVADHTKLLIQLGDFGFWPGRDGVRYVERLGRQLARYDCTLLFLDGNHDWHDGLNALPVDPVMGLRRITHQIWHIPRGESWVWDGVVWMALGGAVSVDKDGRTPGVDWWPQETVGAGDIEHAIARGRVDVMLTHDAPAGVVVPGIDDRPDNGGWSLEAIAESNAHREMLRAVVADVRPSRLWHGHYHVRYSSQLVFEGDAEIPHAVTVGGLAHDIGRWEDSVVLVNTLGEAVHSRASDA